MNRTADSTPNRGPARRFARQNWFWIALLAAGFSTSACSGITCTAEGRDAVIVEVRDSITGSNAAEGALLIVRDGEYVDSVRGGPNEPPALTAAFERPGTYEVVVQKNGYREWVRQGVRVRRTGGCDKLESVRLTALLQPDR